MKLLKLLIIPVLLTLGYSIWVTYPYFFSKINRYDSLGLISLVEERSVNIQKTLSRERKIDKFDNHLFKGEKITSKFKATENNFGILLFRFAKLSDIVSDSVVFRIKEVGSKNWYYESTYKANQFQSDQYFTFGFPSFKNSKNNTYIFEIESLYGTYKNGTGVSLIEPRVALVYKYSLNDLENYQILPPFIFKKFVYVVNNANFWQNWQILASSLFSYVFVIIVKKRIIIVPKTIAFLLVFKKKATLLLKKLKLWFTSTSFYMQFLNTDTKKRLAIGLLMFWLALIYRFSSSLVNQSLLFYAGLGGQGDYDQFIRAATCAVTNFCFAILGQNFLFEASILGMFYKIFGFTGGLKAYLYLMLIVSSIVATLPYLLLSRKNWITIGGIIGSIFIATSDFLTKVALNFPPDNGSTFTFSIFFIVYFLTLRAGSIRWLLFFGLMGLIDGLNKALFLINDLSAFMLFAPVFFYEKIKSARSETKIASIFKNKNIKILLLSLIPLFVFLILYSAWEYFVYIKFSAYYFLRGLIESRGSSYVAYTSFDGSSSEGSVILQLFFLCVSVIVMIKRLIQYADLQIIFLVPIFLGLLFFFLIERRRKGIVKKFILVFTLSFVPIVLIILVKNNYFKIHEIFAGEYIFGTWTDETYIKIFLFWDIIVLFILNFRYSAIRLSLPIIPYVIMLIIMTKNSPFPRISTQVVVWSIILIAYVIDWTLMNPNKYSRRGIKFILGQVFLILFICVYIVPKMATMILQLNSGLRANQNQVVYLRWVEESLPANAIVLAGGKSDLVTVAENVKRPIVYSTLWNAAVLIKPKEIPGVKPTDFEIINQLKHKYNLRINQIQGVSPSDFSIIPELQNRDNFRRNKYIVLEDDIYVWRARLTGAGDGLFTTDSKSTIALHADDYIIKVYKFNPTLKKAIYELNTR